MSRKGAWESFSWALFLMDIAILDTVIGHCEKMEVI